MSNIIVMGKCIRCKTRKEVQEIITSDNGKQKVVLICQRCLNNEDHEIREMVKHREALDTGERYSHADVMKMIDKRINNVVDISANKNK